MKLNKFLIGLTPVVMVGTIVPIVSCGKSNSFNFKYGDDINCLEHQAIPFHSIGDVGNAVKWHVTVEPQGTMTKDQANDILDNNYQNVYFDLIASYTLIQKKGFVITGWNSTSATSVSFYIKDETGEKTITAISASYEPTVDNKFNLKIGDKIVPSYTLKDVKAVD